LESRYSTNNMPMENKTEADKISVDRIDEMLRVVFKELQAMGGQAKVKDILAAVEPKLKLTDYERGLTRTGAIRWSTHIGQHFSEPSQFIACIRCHG
jgi:hypothetical protein